MSKILLLVVIFAATAESSLPERPEEKLHRFQHRVKILHKLLIGKLLNVACYSIGTGKNLSNKWVHNLIYCILNIIQQKIKYSIMLSSFLALSTFTNANY